MRKILIGSLITALLYCSAAFAQGGPGPQPQPWLVIGNAVSYSNGGQIMPSNVTGGSQGIGTINVSGGYYVNGNLLTSLTAIASHTMLCNLTGGSAVPTGCTWAAFANVAISNTNGALPYRTGGTWGTISTGTIGATIPLNNTANIFSAVQSINLNATAAPTAQTDTVIQLTQADTIAARLELNAFGAPSRLTGIRANGTNASPTTLVANDEIISNNAWGYDGTTRSGPASTIRQYAGGTWSNTSHPTYIDFSTTAAASTTLTSRMRIENDGGITVGGVASQGSGTLNLLGALYNNGTAPSGTGAYLRGTAPSMSSPVITTTFTATGLVGLPNLATQIANTVVANFTSGSASPVAFTMPSCTGSANALQYVNGTGITCSAIVAAAGSVAISTTTITGGTSTRVLYDNAGVLGEYTISGSGTTVAMTTGPTITGPSLTGITALGIRSTGAAFDMTIANTEVLTAGRTLTITLNDTARTINLGGNITLGGALTTTPANGVTFTTTGATNVTLPVSGTLATLAGTEALTGKTYNGLTITTTTGTFTLTNAKTLAVTNTLTLSGTDSTVMTFPTTTATIARTDAGQTFTGTQAFATITASSTVTITSASASALAVGLNGATNPAFVVDSSTASQAAGLKVTGAATGGTVAIAAIDSGSNTNLTINAKGTGTIGIGSVSTGAVTITPNVTHTGTTTMSAAITYGGVTLSNSVTGTGSMVLSTSATLVTPALGVATATSINGLTITTSTGTLTVANGKTLTASNSITLAGTDSTTWTGPLTNATLAALNIQGQVLAGGATVTSLSLSTGSLTVDCGARPLQYITGSTSAWSFTAPAADGSCMILLTNASSSAVIPSFSGFTVGSNTGGTLTSTGSSKFTVQIWRINGTSAYTIFAHQ